MIRIFQVISPVHSIKRPFLGGLLAAEGQFHSALRSQPRAAMLSGQRRSLNPYPLSLSLPPFFFRLFACHFSRLSNFPRFFESTNMRLETNTISRHIALLRYLISGLEETKLHRSEAIPYKQKEKALKSLWFQGAAHFPSILSAAQKKTTHPNRTGC